MLISNSAAGNAGVDKSFDLTPTPVLHMAGERTREAVSTLVAQQATRHAAAGAGASGGSGSSHVGGNHGGGRDAEEPLLRTVGLRGGSGMQGSE